MKSIESRLMMNVEKIPFSGCWIWMGATDKDGYGRISLSNRANATHRISYRVFNGADANHVCHTCDVPACINPYHLFDGSHSDNMRDREAKGRANKAVGLSNGNSRFSDEQINAMRLMKEAGSSLSQIAKQFDISSTGYVSLVVNGKTRKTNFSNPNKQEMQ